jgi:hypothetical protein
LANSDIKIDDLIAAISISGFLELPITTEHAAAVNNLPDYYRDHVFNGR